MIAKAAAAANIFLPVPFVLHALGATQFGVWATLVSFVALSNFLDFGFGNGTMNLVAAAQGRGTSQEIPVILRESQRALFRVATSVALSAAVLVMVVPWYRVLGVSENHGVTARLASAVVLLSIVLAIPLNMANRAQLGLGQGDRAFRWQAAGQLMTLGVVILVALSNGTLITLTAASVLTPLLGSIGNWLELRRSLFAKTHAAPASPTYARQIRREGFSFFLLQLSASLAYSLDLPLISALRSPAEAGTYAVAQRLFSLTSMSLALIWAPLWPMYRQALASGDYAWAHATFRRSVWMAVTYAALVCAFLVMGYSFITSFWLHHATQTSTWLLAGLALWGVVEAIGTATATYLNAASVLRYQLILGIPFAITTASIKAFALRFTGPNILPWITTLTYIGLVLLPLAVRAKAIHRIIRHSSY